MKQKSEMKTDTWMPLYTGDYLRDTMHLNAEGNGAYILLIIHYWTKGKIQDDNEILMTITRVSHSNWARVRGLIAPFFVIKDGFWTHPRIEEEKAEAIKIQEANSARAAAAASARWGKDASSNSQAMREDMLGDAPSPSPSPTQSQINLTNFAEFWSAYPRKIAKPIAFKSYVKSIACYSHDVIMDGLRRHLGCEQWTKDGGKFIPHPATWLNQERFNDHPQQPAQQKRRDIAW